MLDDDRVSLPEMDGGELSDAYAWATTRPRVITLGEDARPLWRIVRRYARILGETLPEAQSVFIERTAEQTLRVAACLAASESSEVITDEMLSAAFALVRRSVQDAVRITKGADAPKAQRQSLSLADKVRARIEMHGGRATSSQVLPYVGASASEVKALPGIVVAVDRSGRTGRPATVFTLRSDSSQHEESAPAKRTVMESNRAEVVRMDAFRPAPTQAPEVRPMEQPTPPATAENPFRSLL
ncbi:hypothetical protein ACIQWN_02270 [Streptomyces vinaceus]|uniref:hypothetical protein n=1 Tax=Streptomyces vinaceus TaxID=1960 RepID=UPI0037F429EC